MHAYRTQIIVPPDRYVYVQLPADFPLGSAIVIVESGPGSPEGPSDLEPSAPTHLEPVHERDDIEWWEEFDDEAD